MPTKEEILRENTLRMRRFNRNWSMDLYWSYVHHMPELPRLMHEDGIDRYYVPPVREYRVLPADQNPHPIGAGPDEHNYYLVNEPDYHSPGMLYQTEQGKTYCLVETPAADGMQKRWMQVA